MSTTYVIGPARSARVERRRHVFPAGLASGIAGIVAFGAVVAITMQPATVRVALPPMEASMGYWDQVDARPAIHTAGDAEVWWDTNAAIPSAAVEAPRYAVRETGQGYEFVPLPPGGLAEGYWDPTNGGQLAAAGLEATDLPAMSAHQGYWDFVLPTTDTLATVPFDEARAVPGLGTMAGYAREEDVAMSEVLRTPEVAVESERIMGAEITPYVATEWFFANT